MGSSEIRVTHDVLGQMLGIHRPSVTIALRKLEDAGYIESRHGRTRILHREGLVAAACNCYPVTQHLLEGLYPSHGPDTSLL